MPHLNDEQRTEIRQMKRDHPAMKLWHIAEVFGVTAATICQVLNARTKYQRKPVAVPKPIVTAEESTPSAPEPFIRPVPDHLKTARNGSYSRASRI